MEINDNDIRLANNTLAIDSVCSQKKHIKEFEIQSLEARIANVEDRIVQQKQYLAVLNNDLNKFKNLHSELDDKHTRLIQERRELLGQTK